MGFWFALPGFRAEGFAGVLAGTPSNFIAPLCCAEESAEEVSEARCPEDTDELSAGRSDETAATG